MGGERKSYKKQFDRHFRPFISTAKRGFECQIPHYKVFNYILYQLHTGCQWCQLPTDPDPEHPEKNSLGAVYYLFRKWIRDGSLEKIWRGSIVTIAEQLDFSELNLNSTYAIAKKGGK